ncbi:hypothetical protein OAU26_03805 [Mariniblastus sp.]|nr:hypothetical protein [Mariniblastus sp.]
MNRQISALLVSTLPLIYNSFTEPLQKSLPIALYASTRILSVVKIPQTAHVDWKELSCKTRLGAVLAMLACTLTSWLAVPTFALGVALYPRIVFLDKPAACLLLYSSDSILDLFLCGASLWVDAREIKETPKEQLHHKMLQILQDCAFTFTLGTHAHTRFERMGVLVFTACAMFVACQDRLPLFKRSGPADGVYKEL